MDEQPEKSARDTPRDIPPGASPPDPTELEASAHGLLVALRASSSLPRAEARTAIADETRRFQRAASLTVDGVYGPRTRSALARALYVPVSSLPPARTGTAAPAPADSPDPPGWLTTAAALARWSEDARASDSRASRELARLAPHSNYLAARTRSSMRGLEVGQVPSAPSAADVAAWARAAWERARAEGAAARGALASHSNAIIREAERALVNVRRALDRETDIAARGALEALERTLVAILRPASQAIRNIVEPLGGGLAAVGVGLLLLWAASRGRRR